MDAFYASVEQRDDPQLRGKPVIVAWQGNRSVVCAASYEARSFGVHSAMPAIRAERLCPDATFVPPDFTRYRAVSRSVREIFKRHTDLIEPLSLDEAYLDVTENKTGLATATLVARTIREQIRQELNLTASAGVAPNKFLAKLASDWRKPDGLFVIRPEDIDAFLLPLPVGRLPGVGKVTGEKLAKLGAQTVRDLRTLDLPFASLLTSVQSRRIATLSISPSISPLTARQYIRSSGSDCNIGFAASSCASLYESSGSAPGSAPALIAARYAYKAFRSSPRASNDCLASIMYGRAAVQLYRSEK